MTSVSKLLLVLAGVAFLQVAQQARAELSEDWTFCDTCTTKAQFESAAVAHIGRNYGDYVVEVGNTVTSKVYEVSVTISDTPIDPTRAPPVASGASAPATGVIYLDDVDVDGIPSSDTEAASEPLATSGARYVIINYSLALSSQTNTQFGAIVAMAKMDPLLLPPPNPGTMGYESFGGRDMAVLNRDFWDQLTARYPSWQQGQISGGPFRALLNALKLTQGKGPTVCQVFINGDVACFQLNWGDDLAARYVAGTAKDAEGNPLSDNGGLGSGGGGGITVNHVSNSPYVTGYKFPTGSWWLMCTYVNGVKVSCRVQWVAE